MDRFSVGHSGGADWHAAVEACAARLDPAPAGANLGFVYTTDHFADDFGKIVATLVERTGIKDWVGTTGVGICATGREYFGEPAVAAMAGRFPEGSFALFDTVEDDPADFVASRRAWLARSESHFGVVHGDPRHPRTAALIPGLADATDCFLVGGLVSSRGACPQVAGTLCQAALSGVMFDGDVPVATALTQGCAPIGPVREITACRDNVVFEIAGRPALDVFKEDIGEAFAGDLASVAGKIYAAFPVRGSDRADYTVRNLVAIDTENGLIAIAEPLDEGRQIMFCRRDRETARADLDRMLADLTRRAGGEAKGAVYFSCLARGPQMFGGDSAELEQIRGAIGDVPLVGFFCNGEISHDRLYAYTGVLSLFL